MNTELILNSIVRAIRAIPVKLSGDDSPLADPWEEIKEQVQHEMSFFWQAYLDTMTAFIEGTVDSLSQEDRITVAGELNVSPEDLEDLYDAILERLIEKAENEKVGYAPFDFSRFRYSLAGMAVYAEVLERTGVNTCQIVAYSGAAPYGERGEVTTDIIEATMSEDEFEEARQKQWPDRWE